MGDALGIAELVEDNDLHLVRVSLEYFMKQVDDNCYKKHKTLGETLVKRLLKRDNVGRPTRDHDAAFPTHAALHAFGIVRVCPCSTPYIITFRK